jgi:serine/threonine protein kinase
MSKGVQFAEAASPSKEGIGHQRQSSKTNNSAGTVDAFFHDSIKRSVSKDFEILERLGNGAFGVVKRAKNNKTGEIIAIKSLKKAACKPKELQDEVRILRMVNDHPGIVKLRGVYESKNRVNILMELITGGELFDKIVEIESYSETDAASLIKQVAAAVEHCHNNGIIHRDLKPENLLFENETSNVLKLIDFGVAYQLPPSGLVTSGLVGSRTYMAPEIQKGHPYGKPCDMYSIGVILYIILCGYPPFDPDEGIYELDFPEDDWSDVSMTAKEIIVNLLDDDPNKRYTATQLKNLDWTQGKDTSKKVLRKTVRSMNKFNTYRKVKTTQMGTRTKRVSVFGTFGLTAKKAEVQSNSSSAPDDPQLRTKYDAAVESLTGSFKDLHGLMIALASKSVPSRRSELTKTAEELWLLKNALLELTGDFSSKL